MSVPLKIPCFLCLFEFYDINSLNIHLRCAHPGCRQYVCKLPGCLSRSYNLYPSFRDHLRRIHNIPFKSEGLPNLNILHPVDVGNGVDVGDGGASDVLSNSDCHNVDEAQNLNYEELLTKEEDVIVARLYSNPAFPRNLVDLFLKQFSDYLSCPIFDHLRELVTLSLGPEVPASTVKDIESIFERLRKPFPHFQTEYKRIQYFERCGDYIAPISYKISSREERVRSVDGVKLQMKDVLGQFIPLRKLFGRFFELPNVLSDTLAYMKSLDENCDLVSNIIQCEVWKRKRERYHKDDIVIPVNIYYDECEPNKALGPHCDPIGCTYVHIPVLPPEWCSKLENIFLALIFDGDNRTLYGNQRCFKPLIEELTFLEKVGITVLTECGTLHVFLVTLVLLGDNKGLNGICGFMEGFTASFFCRICTAPKSVTDNLYKEDASLLRTPLNYYEHVKCNDSSKTGVKEECIFNQIPSFITPTDIAVDEFHDVVEGIAHYTMVPVLRHFNCLNRMFIPTLNSRLYCVDLGVDGDNRPPLISADKLASFSKLKMTGAEMTTFVRIFGTLVIDMVPDKDPYYQLYLYLHDILSLVHAKALPKTADVLLSLIVNDHNKLYVKLTKENLKPKHHHLLHYGTLFKRLGPFRLLSTIRFEAKHHLLLQTASTCMSRVNLARTIAIKQQLAFCFRSVSKSSYTQALTTGPCHEVDLRESEMFLTHNVQFPEFLPTLQTVATWVVYKGTKYEPKQVLVTHINEIRLLIFMEIKLIIVHGDKLFFVCSPFETLGFHSHVRGYEVKRSPANEGSWLIVEQDKLIDPQPLCLFTLSNGDKVVIMKHYM